MAITRSKFLLLALLPIGLAAGYGFVLDRSPTAEFTDPPEQISGSRLRLAYQASDDISVERLRLELRLQDRALLAGDQTMILEMPMDDGGVSGRSLIQRLSTLDLSAHPWAGLAVELRVLARDGAGQEGRSEEVKLVLPQRQFKNQTARAIIAQRRRLALLKRGSRKKIERDIIVGLQLIKDKPQTFHGDSVVFLALSVAQARLVYDQNTDKYGSVMELLWNTAIRLEKS